MSRTPSRRAILQHAAAVALAVPAAAGQKGKAVSSPAGAIPIVDTHQHLWDLQRFRLPWLQGVPQINRSFVMKDYLEATAGLNVVKTVYMEVDVEPSQQHAEAEYVIDLCRRDDNPMAGAVISGRPGLPGFREYVNRYRENRYIKGVRQVLQVPETRRGACLEPEFVRSIRLLGEMGKSFDLCMRAAEIPDGAKLAELCPETRFILDHCGNPSLQVPERAQWRADIAAIARRPNVICKVSGFIATGKPGQWKPADLAPIVNHVLKEFGPDRVIFGGDWPVCTLAATFREWVGALREVVADRPAAEQRKLFHDNAVRFYGLA